MSSTKFYMNIDQEKNLSDSAKTIFTLLLSNLKPISTQELVEKSNYSPRMVQYSLKKLMNYSLVQVSPDFKDLRKKRYELHSNIKMNLEYIKSYFSNR